MTLTPILFQGTPCEKQPFPLVTKASTYFVQKCKTSSRTYRGPETKSEASHIAGLSVAKLLHPRDVQHLVNGVDHQGRSALRDFSFAVTEQFTLEFLRTGHAYHTTQARELLFHLSPLVLRHGGHHVAPKRTVVLPDDGFPGRDPIVVRVHALDELLVLRAESDWYVCRMLCQTNSAVRLPKQIRATMSR